MRKFKVQLPVKINPALIFATGLLFVPLLITIAVYWPGLRGAFLFDDIPNFTPLESYARLDDYTRVVNFIFSGSAGPSGRPISLASFMLNDTAWPSDPWSFKYTNLMIHVLNGVLIFWLLYKILRAARQPEKTSIVFASIVSLVWLVHPLNVSTVLYVIQRMTELGTLFTLAGLLSFVYGRDSLRRQRTRAAVWNLCLAYPLFGLLAIYSKEIGVTLLLYIIVLELTLLQTQPVENNRTLYRVWYGCFVVLPLLFVCGYLAATFSLQSYQIRDFTLAQRLLTESRILVDYLGQILLPRLGSSGLYHDDYPLSTGLLTPVTTLLSCLLLVTILGASITYRKSHPYYSFAVLWFLAGHALESTFLPLELYFEHRNYLPMLAPLLALSYFLVIDVHKLRRVKYAAMAVFTLMCIVNTAFNTVLWGKPKVSTVVWAEEHPASIRAQQAAAAMFYSAAKPENGEEYIQLALQHHPHNASLLLLDVLFKCAQGHLTEKHLQQLLSILPQASKKNLGSVHIVEIVADNAKNAVCPPLDIPHMHKIIEAYLNNDNFASARERHALYYFQARLFEAQRKLDPAMEAMDNSFRYKKIIEIPLQQAIWLNSANLTDAALKYLEIAKQLDRSSRNPLLHNTRSKEINDLERIIKQNAARRAAKPPQNDKNPSTPMRANETQRNGH